MRILPSGDRALLAEFDDLGAAMSAFARLSAGPPAGVVDLVPAARTVLARIDPRMLGLGAAERWIRATLSTSDPAVDVVEPTAHPAEVVIPVRYDGPDLAAAADALGLGPGELVAAHTVARWTSAFIGFAPGFAYLASPDWAVETPRRTTSRPRVPAGSVGLAGAFSGVYPRQSPGGWQLLGTTEAVLWDVDRDPPALLAPGTVVRFEAIP